MGAIIFFLFVLGVFIVKGHLKWGLLAAFILSVLLAWGHNFMAFSNFFLNYVPGYNKFRAVSMTLVIAELCVPLLALLTLKEIMNNPLIIKEKISEFIIALSVTGGLALIFYLLPGIFFKFITPQEMTGLQDIKNSQPELAATVDMFANQLKIVRISILKADALRSFAFILAAAALIIVLYFRKLKPHIFILILAALIIADMWTIDRRYLNNDAFVNRRLVEKPFQPTVADEIILKDVDPYFRVLNLASNTFNEVSTSYFHKSIGGYHGAKLQRYQDLIDHHISKGNEAVLNILNTKYIITTDQNKQPVAQINFQAMGNAWLVSRYKEVENADAEIDALNNFEPELYAIIDKRFSDNYKNVTLEHDPEANIELKSYAPNKLTYKASSETSQIAVFSDIYYDKGWNAFLNGNPVPHFRVNYILRAIILPQGEHDIEFRFEPKSYYTGEKISLAGSVLMAILILGFIAVEIKRKLNSHIS